MKRRYQRKIAGSSMAEFGPALMILFTVILFPLLALSQFASGAIVVWLISQQSATACANANEFTAGCGTGSKAALQILNSGLGRYAKLVPAKAGGAPVVRLGGGGSGVEFQIEETNIGTNQTRNYQAKLKTPVDQTANIYEIVSTASYDVGPFLDMSKLPFIGDVPLLGKPASLSMTSRRHAEYPEGLSDATSYVPAPEAPPL